MKKILMAVVLSVMAGGAYAADFSDLQSLKNANVKVAPVSAAVKVAAPGFEVTARTADGLIEAIERPASRLVLGVQWHPEKIFF